MTPSVSQEDLSGRLARLGIQITQTSLSKLENQQRYVMDYEVAGIAKALRIDIASLFTDTGQPGAASAPPERNAGK